MIFTRPILNEVQILDIIITSLSHIHKLTHDVRYERAKNIFLELFFLLIKKLDQK